MQARSIFRGILVLTVVGASALLAFSVAETVQSGNDQAGTGLPVTQNSACPDDDFEDDNDEPGTTSFFSLPFYQSGLRACPGDLDYYIFPLGSGDEIQIDAFFDHEEGNIQVSVFDQSGTFLTAATSSTDNEKLVFTADGSGNYRVLVFVEVPDLGTAPGNTYTLQAGFPGGQCPDDEFENNDTEGTAVQTGVPIYLDGLRACPGDDDFFRIGLVPGPVQIDAFFTHAEGNLNLRLVDPGGVVTTSFSTTDNEKLVTTVTETGVYILGVSNVDDLGSAEGNTYALQISQGGLCPDDALEENNTFETAAELSVPFYQAGLRVCPDSSDFYSFSASEGDELQIDAFFTAAEGEIGMVLFDPNMDPVVANPSTSIDNKKVTHTAAMTGDYFLLVVVNLDTGTAAGNTYALQITGPKPPTVTPTATPPDEPTATPTVTATPPEDADLVVKSIDVSPPKPEAGESFDVTVEVSNQGLAPAGAFFVDFYADLPGPPSLGQAGDFLCNVDGGLAAGASFECSASGSFEDPGSYDMWAQVDTGDDVDEANEGNNVFGPRKLDVNEEGAPTATPTSTFTQTSPPTSTPTSPPPATDTPAPTATDTPRAGLLGDVNCNQSVDAIDVALLLQLIAGLLPSLDCEADADVNLDGNGNSIDVALILQLIAGLLADLPP